MCNSFLTCFLLSSSLCYVTSILLCQHCHPLALSLSLPPLLCHHCHPFTVIIPLPCHHYPTLSASSSPCSVIITAPLLHHHSPVPPELNRIGSEMPTLSSYISHAIFRHHFCMFSMAKRLPSTRCIREALHSLVRNWFMKLQWHTRVRNHVKYNQCHVPAKDSNPARS